MIYVVADTNALLLPFKVGFNLDAELGRLLGDHELVIPEPIIGELEKLSSRERAATAALKLARSRTVMGTRALGDGSVLELAQRLNGVIMTNDRGLMARARESGIRVIRQRGRARLEFNGRIEPK